MEYSKYEDDNELKQLLDKFYKKEQRYINSPQRIVKDNETLDLFEKVVPKIDGKRMSVEQFKTRYEDKLHYKIAIMENMLDKNFLKNINKNYKDNIVTMLEKMGNFEEARNVEKMSLRKFIENANKGDYDNVKEMYKSQKEYYTAEQLLKNIEEFYEIDDIDYDLLGY